MSKIQTVTRKHIRKELHKSRLTQSDASLAVGRNRDFFSAYLSGQRNITPKFLQTLRPLRLGIPDWMYQAIDAEYDARISERNRRFNRTRSKGSPKAKPLSQREVIAANPWATMAWG